MFFILLTYASFAFGTVNGKLCDSERIGLGHPRPLVTLISPLSEGRL